MGFERRRGKKPRTGASGTEQRDETAISIQGAIHGARGPAPQAGTSGAKPGGEKAPHRAETSGGPRRTTLHWIIRGRTKGKNW